VVGTDTRVEENETKSLYGRTVAQSHLMLSVMATVIITSLPVYGKLTDADKVH